MKKVIKRAVAFIIAAFLVFTLSACNRQMIDLNYKYDQAIISLPNGNVVEGKVQSWSDYEDGDQIQVKIDDVTYLVHSSNIVLIYGGN